MTEEPNIKSFAQISRHFKQKWENFEIPVAIKRRICVIKFAQPDDTPLKCT